MRDERVRSGILNRLSLTPKLILATLVVGALVWGVEDFFFSRILRNASDAQLLSLLQANLREERIRFDNRLGGFHSALELIASRRQLLEHLSQRGWFREAPAAPPIEYETIPPWLPDASTLRRFVPVRFALLLDGAGRVQEYYSSLSRPPPGLLAPSPRILRMSEGQSFVTALDGAALVISSEMVSEPGGAATAYLLLASPLDDRFLIAGKGLLGADRPVGLLSGEPPTVIASSRPDLIPAGTPLARLEKEYLIIGKSFFDLGSSEVSIQFSSFVPRSAFAAMNAAIIRTDRYLRAVISLSIVLALGLIMIVVTRRIKRLTVHVEEMSSHHLGLLPAALRDRDQLAILEAQFDLFSAEIVRSRAEVTRRAEALLREKTIYLDQVLRASPLATIALDLDLRVMYFSPAAETLFGYSAVVAVGKLIREFDTDQSILPHLAGAALDEARGGKDHTFTVSRERQGVSEILDMHLSSVRDREGSPVGFLLLAQDTTAEYAVQGALRHSVAVQSAVNAIMDVSLSDESLTVILRRALELILAIEGLALEAMGAIFLFDKESGELVMAVEKNLPSSHPKECRRLPIGRCCCGRAAAARQIFFGKSTDAAHEIVCEGMPHHGHYCVPILKGDELLGLLNLYTALDHERSAVEEDFLQTMADTLAGVIVRRRAEARLQESERRYRNLFEQATDAIFVLDLAGNFIDVNSVGHIRLGYSKKEMLGLQISELDASDIAAKVPERLRQIQEQGIAVFESAHRRKDGSVMPVEINTRLMEDGGRKVLFSIVRDITERKKAENDRRALEEQLQQASKMESIGRLAGGIAHDFNNILSAIIGYSELALYRLPEDSPLREEISNVVEAGERAAVLTRQLLAFSRRQVLKMEAVDVSVIVTNLAKMLTRVIREDIALAITTRGQGNFTVADPGQLEQVIINLAVNARDAMPAGGTLTIEIDTAQVDANEARRYEDMRPGRYVVLAVRDSGSGIPPEVRTRIFEPFFTTKEQGQGTGLGLATVYGIVRQHHGYIGVESVVGKGTTFRIFLPYDERAVPEEIARQATVLPCGTETVIVVDDDDMVRDLTVQILRDLGYRVLSAAGGEAALENLEREQTAVDLLLTDVIMPGMSGRELAERALAAWPRMKVLFMTGHIDGDVKLDDYQGVGRRFLDKPVSPRKIAFAVRELLDSA